MRFFVSASAWNAQRVRAFPPYRSDFYFPSPRGDGHPAMPDNGTDRVHVRRLPMAVSQTTATATAVETSGIFAEAVGGIATIVLTIIALSGTSTAFLLAAATIVFGAALLIEGTSITTDYVGVLSSAANAVAVQGGSGGLAAIFLAGISGIILGVLALLGIN